MRPFLISRAVRSRAKQEGQEPDMTPMVDVTFLLLIFFMVTAAFRLQKSIPMPHEQSELPSKRPDVVPQDELVTVTVEIDEFNGYLVIAKDFEHQAAYNELQITEVEELN